MRARTRPNIVHTYTQSPILTGIARLIDPFGSLDNFDMFSGGYTADYYALRSDWMAVGNDMRKAIRTYQAHLDSKQND